MESDLHFSTLAEQLSHYSPSKAQAVWEILCWHWDEKSTGLYKLQTCTSAPVAATYLYL